MKNVFIFVFFGVLCLPPVLYSQTQETQFNKYFSQIKTQGISTVDDAIGLLPDAHKKYFTLMKSSKSLQHATPANPRAILFGEDAKFIVAFSANSSPNSHTIETAEFVEGREEVVFRAIDFSSGIPTASEENPELCQACHGRSPNYTWGSYNKWEGQYAGVHDVLPNDILEDFRDFKANAPTQPRYRHLNFLPNKENTEYPFRLESAGPSLFTFDFSPGWRLGKFVARWSGRNFIGKYKKNPKFSMTKRMFLISYLRCRIDREFEDQAGVDLFNKAKAFTVKYTEPDNDDIEFSLNLMFRAYLSYLGFEASDLIPNHELDSYLPLDYRDGRMQVSSFVAQKILEVTPPYNQNTDFTSSSYDYYRNYGLIAPQWALKLDNIALGIDNFKRVNLCMRILPGAISEFRNLLVLDPDLIDL